MTSEPNKEIKEEITLKEDLKKLLEDCQKQRDEYLAGWQRARADFLNYKKDEIERFENIINIANEEMVLKILPLLDNLELAEKHLPKDLENNEYVKGILQIKAQFLDLLKNMGIETVQSIDRKFDPALHDVLEEIEIKGKESGIIIEEIQKGYLINNKLLRPVKVKVSK